MNGVLRDLVGQYPGVTFLDVFNALTDANGDRRKDLTTDGLNADGYLVLGGLLRDQAVS